MSQVDKTKRVGRWYFGGTASAMAACCTHPLDLLKVHLQTQQSGNIGLFTMGGKVLKSDGIRGLYNGISASVGRQLTYSLMRFAMYETAKKELTKDGRLMPFYEKVAVAGVAGFCGGFVGTPCDLINVRLQNDVKIPAEQRRNYKHVFDGLWKVYKYEGPSQLLSGATMASTRAVFVTVGQIAFYDQFKYLWLKYVPYSKDNMMTHFCASFMAGGVATFLTMPLDVMKTRMMNAPPGYYKTIFSCVKDVGANGLTGFFKGFIPAFVRLGPHTVLTFIFFEQIRMYFGDDPAK